MYVYLGAFLASIEEPDFQWLLSNKEPWATVREKWEKTRDLRLQFRNHCTQNTDYLDPFPCTKEPLGWELVSVLCSCEASFNCNGLCIIVVFKPLDFISQVANDGILDHPALSQAVDLWNTYVPKLLKLIRLDKPRFRLPPNLTEGRFLPFLFLVLILFIVLKSAF